MLNKKKEGHNSGCCGCAHVLLDDVIAHICICFFSGWFYFFDLILAFCFSVQLQFCETIPFFLRPCLRKMQIPQPQQCSPLPICWLQAQTQAVGGVLRVLQGIIEEPRALGLPTQPLLWCHAQKQIGTILFMTPARMWSTLVNLDLLEEKHHYGAVHQQQCTFGSSKSKRPGTVFR